MTVSTDRTQGTSNCSRATAILVEEQEKGLGIHVHLPLQKVTRPTGSEITEYMRRYVAKPIVLRPAAEAKEGNLE